MDYKQIPTVFYIFYTARVPVRPPYCFTNLFVISLYFSNSFSFFSIPVSPLRYNTARL